MLSGRSAKYLLAMVLFAGVAGLIFLQYASAQYAKTGSETQMADTEMKKASGQPSAPLVQIAQGIAPSDVKCKDSLQLVFKSSNNMPACVRPSSVHRLVELGWAKPEDAMNAGTKPSETIHKIDLSATEEDDVYRWSDSDGINPTITVLANTENEIQIQNPTDAKHEFVIESEGEEVVASGDISADSSGKLTVTPSAAGTWEYHCEYHPSTMKGTIQIISP
ncbi:MAG: hypothetical protein EPO62_02775 [Candidatus Nitrosotenuis sp.]|nr:MAG: hypothetical protein EPO62_02775 [Candidatus Nitrosotenuis sp.]